MMMMDSNQTMELHSNSFDISSQIQLLPRHSSVQTLAGSIVEVTLMMFHTLLQVVNSNPRGFSDKYGTFHAAERPK